MTHINKKIIYNTWLLISVLFATTGILLYFTNENIENEGRYNSLAISTVCIGVSYLLMQLLFVILNNKSKHESNI